MKNFQELYHYEENTEKTSNLGPKAPLSSRFKGHFNMVLQLNTALGNKILPSA